MILGKRGSEVHKGIDLGKLKGYGFTLLSQNPLQISNPYSIDYSRANYHQNSDNPSQHRGQSSSIDKIKNYFRSPRQVLPFHPEVYPIFNEQVLMAIGNTLSLYNLKFRTVSVPKLRLEKEQQEQVQQQKYTHNNQFHAQQTDSIPSNKNKKQVVDDGIHALGLLTPKTTQAQKIETIQRQEPYLQKISSVQTYHDIKNVVIPDKRYYQHNSEVCILLTFSNSSQIIVVKQDYREQKIDKVHTIYFKNQKIESIFSVTDSEFIICCTDKDTKKLKKGNVSGPYQVTIKLYYYYISPRAFKLKKQLKIIKKLKKNEELTAIDIGGKIVQEQDCSLLLFMAIYDKKILTSKIVAKEFIKCGYGDLQLLQSEQFNENKKENQSFTSKLFDIPFSFIKQSNQKKDSKSKYKTKSHSEQKKVNFSSTTLSSFTSKLFNISDKNYAYENPASMLDSDKLSISSARRKNNGTLSFQTLQTQQRGVDALSSESRDHNVCQNQQFLVISSIKQAITQIKMFYRNDSFFFFMCDQIVIVRKKFGKYQIIDSVADKIKNEKVCFCKTSELFCTSGKQGLQLYHLQISDSKCNYRLIDVIEQQRNTKKVRRTLNSIWTYERNSQIHIGLIFMGQMGKLYFQGVKSIQQIKKLTQYAYQGPKQQVGKVQQMAQKLGISKKDFYIMLWSISKKNLSDIYSYLLPSCDLKSIHYEFSSFLRKKQLPAGEIIKVLNKIEKIIFDYLSQHLEVSMLKWYIKNNFLMRKFSLYPVDLKIDWSWFQSIYNMSINDIIRESIDQQLFPQAKPLYTFGVPQPKKKPKIYINHALQQFRLVLLQNYEKFLVNLLRNYPKSIALILENFTYLLPKHPLYIEMVSQQNTGLAQSLIAFSSIVRNQLNVQQIWFSNVTIAQWNRQKMRKDVIIDKLKPYHPTSQIMNKMQLLIQDPWFQKRRLERHTLIESTKSEYQQILKSMNDKHLYLAICQFANQMEYKCLVQNGQASLSLHYHSTIIGNHMGTIGEERLKNESKFYDSNNNQTQLNILTHTLTGVNQTQMFLQKSLLQKSVLKPNSKQKEQKSFVNAIPVVKADDSGHNKIDKQNRSISNQLNPLDLLFGNRLPGKESQSKQAKESLNNASLDLTKSFALDPIQQKRNTKKRVLASKRILLSLKKQNRLNGDAFDECKLYLAIHHFLQIQSLIQKQLTVQQLLDMTDAELVSLFFLGNKQKKYLIFNQFRSLYPSVEKFNSVIGNFANSESSSIIQLQILLMQITGKKKNNDQISSQEQYRLTEFQRNNQELIKVIIDGVCKKIQLWEVTPMVHFFVLINNVQLNKDLLVLINKIHQLRRCLGIFVNFYMDSKTYYQILNDSRGTIHQIMEQYFKGKVLHHSVNVDKHTIPLNYTRNTFNLLLYLREAVFYDISQTELLMIYGQILIDWQQFQVLQELLYHDSTMQMMQTEEIFDIFVNQLLIISLDKIYSKEDMIFNQPTKQHIRNILKLQRKVTPFTIKQYSKLYIVRLFQRWGYLIRPIYLQTMCQQWEQSIQNRRQLIREFFAKYIDSIGHENFQELYLHFQMSATGDPNVQIYSKQYYEYCKMLAQRLVEKERSSEATQLISILRLSGEVQAGYQLESRCALTCLSKNKGLQGLEMSRRCIEYMALNYQDDEAIANLFGTCFNQLQILQKYSSIDVHESLCFRQHGKAGQSQFMKKHGITVPIDGLWDITNTLYQYKSDLSTIKGLGALFDQSNLVQDDAIINQKKESLQQSVAKTRKRSKSQFNNSQQNLKPTQSVILDDEEQKGNDSQISNTMFSIFAHLFTAANDKNQQTSSNTLNPNNSKKRNKNRKASVNIQSMNSQIYNPIMNSYYFLLMGLRFPHLGFQHLYSLPYSLNMLAMLLHRLDNMVHKYKSLWRMNVQQVYQRYRKGLYALLLKEVDVDHQEIELSQHFYQQIRQRVINTPNSDIIKVHITKLQAQLQNVKNKRKQRQKIHQQQCKKNNKIMEKQVEVGQDDQEQHSEHHIDDDSANRSYMNVTCTYQQVKDIKKQINAISNDLTDKLIIDTVVDQMNSYIYNNPEGNNSQILNKTGNRLNNSTPIALLDAMTKQIIRQTKQRRDFIENKNSRRKPVEKVIKSTVQQIKNCTISEFQIWVMQKRYDKISLIPRRITQERLYQLLMSQIISFETLIQVLKQTKIGNMHKIEPFGKINKHWLKIHDNNLRTIFSLQYLISFEVKSQEQIFEQLIAPNLRPMASNMPLAQVTSLGQMLSQYFDNPAVQHQIYGVAIQAIGQSSEFEDEFVFKLESLVKDTDIQYLMANYTKLMDSMVNPMLREVCHKSIMKKVQQQFQSHATEINKLQPRSSANELQIEKNIKNMGNYALQQSQILAPQY